MQGNIKSIGESINFGDILLARGKFLNSSTDYLGPIIYLGRDNNRLYGLKLSPIEKKKDFNKYLKIIVLTREYNLKKTSTIDFRNIVEFKISNIQKKISSLSMGKLNEIMKMIFFILKNNQNKFHYQISDFNKIIDISSYIPHYSRGDLIKYYNGYLLITNNDSINITGYKVYLKSSERYRFDTGDKKVNYIIYDNPVQIPIKNQQYCDLKLIMSNYFMCYVDAKKYAFCNKNCKDVIDSRVNYDLFSCCDDLLNQNQYHFTDGYYTVNLSKKMKVKSIFKQKG